MIVKEAQSCPAVCDYSPWNYPGQNTGVGSFSILQENLPNPGIEPRSPTLQVDSSLSGLPGKPNNVQKAVQLKSLGKDRDYIVLSSTHKIIFIIPLTDTDKGGVFQINSYIPNSRNYFNVFHKNTISCGIAHNGITWINL